MQAPNSVMAYEKEFFHLRWREKKREKLQGGASAAGGASTAGGSPAVGDWRWFPSTGNWRRFPTSANFGASLSNPLNLFMGMHS